MALNTQVDLTVTANAIMSPMNIQQGQVFVGDNGIEYRKNLGPGFIEIPWRNIDYISVEIMFGFYYRGFIVVTTNGQKFEFVATHVKKVMGLAAQQLRPNQLRRRTSIFTRQKSK
jgi:hypothetical protein